MSLSTWEQQTLDSIGDVLAGSYPGLAMLLATFSELAVGEDMPAAEQIAPRPRLATWLAERRWRRPRHGSMRRCRNLLGQVLSTRWMLPVLWLAIAAALIGTALVLSGGASQGQCPQPWWASCASTVPAHPSGPVTQSTATSEHQAAQH